MERRTSLLRFKAVTCTSFLLTVLVTSPGAASPATQDSTSVQIQAVEGALRASAKRGTDRALRVSEEPAPGVRVAFGAASTSIVAQVTPQTPPPIALRTPRPFPEGARIAFINPQRIVAESALGKGLTAKVSTFRAQRLAELNAKNKEIETAQQKLAGGSLLNQDARTAAQKSLDRLQVEIQRAQQDAEAAMQDLQQQLNDEFERVLTPIVEQVAIDKGVHLLLRLDTGVIAWADPALDLTGDIVKRLDAAKTAATTGPQTNP